MTEVIGKPDTYWRVKVGIEIIKVVDGEEPLVTKYRAACVTYDEVDHTKVHEGMGAIIVKVLHGDSYD